MLAAIVSHSPCIALQGVEFIGGHTRCRIHINSLLLAPTLSLILSAVSIAWVARPASVAALGTFAGVRQRAEHARVSESFKRAWPIECMQSSVGSSLGSCHVGRQKATLRWSHKIDVVMQRAASCWTARDFFTTFKPPVRQHDLAINRVRAGQVCPLTPEVI